MGENGKNEPDRQTHRWTHIHKHTYATSRYSGVKQTERFCALPCPRRPGRTKAGLSVFAQMLPSLAPSAAAVADDDDDDGGDIFWT